MKRFKWISRTSLFGGLLTYMTASFRGLDLYSSLQKAMIAMVVLYGLSIFAMLAYFQLIQQMKRSPKPSKTSIREDSLPGHGMEGASWEREQSASGKGL